MPRASLEAAGARVIVLEATGRIGGRLHTLYDLPGTPEAGAIQVGAGYTRLRAIAAQRGIAISDAAGEGAGREQLAGNLYHINGISVPSQGWADSLANNLTGAERTVEPAALLLHHAGAFPQLVQNTDWRFAPGAQDISVATALRAHGASEEALRLIEANFNGNSLGGMSQLHVSRTLAIMRGAPRGVGTILGGAEALPVAMANALAGDVRVDHSVLGIAEEASRVTVATSSGPLSASHVICTAPFSAMRNLPIEADLPPALARMIAELPYTRASFAYISAREPFWLNDGQPETLWTDLPLIGRVFALGTNPPMLKLWTRGAGADMLDRMPRDMAAQRIIAAIEAARPAARGQLKVERFYSWQNNPHARGIYHHIGTGMAADLAAATDYRGRRLHFAGEHLAQSSSGMEGALESGERTALHVAGLL